MRQGTGRFSGVVSYGTVSAEDQVSIDAVGGLGSCRGGAQWARAFAERHRGGRGGTTAP